MQKRFYQTNTKNLKMIFWSWSCKFCWKCISWWCKYKDKKCKLKTSRVHSYRNQQI